MKKKHINEGIFFITSFDRIDTGVKIPYKKIIIDNLPFYDKDKDYIFYQANNTAINFSNLIEKPKDYDDVKYGKWSYTKYKEYREQNATYKNFAYTNIYYGIFEGKQLVKILRLDQDKLLRAFEKKKENKRNTERYNIPKDAQELVDCQVFPHTTL